MRSYQKIFVLLILIVQIFTCKTTSKRHIYFPLAPYEEAVCRSGYPTKSIAYPTEFYAKTFVTDTRLYKNIIIGDSTMDISRKYKNFISENTQNVAVSGNTFCDMIEQTPAILTPNPQNIIISSAGGNDAIQKKTPDAIISTGKTLISRLRSRFPGSKIILVGIHPTKLDYVNIIRNTINRALEKVVDCYVDPDEYFHIQLNGEPLETELIDKIHYSKDMSFQIKEGILKCGADI